MLILRKCVPLIFCLLLTNLLAHAEVYMWTDEHGRSHFTDTPPPKKDVQPVEISPTNSYKAPDKSQVEETLARPVTRPTKRAAVIMYSAVWCGVCKKAKTWLRANNISFTEYDIEKSERGRRDYEKFGVRSVPIFIVGKRRVRGFRPDRMKALLEKVGYKFK